MALDRQSIEEPEPSAAGPLTGGVSTASEIETVVQVVAEAAVAETDGEPLAEDIEGARLVALNMALNGPPRRPIAIWPRTSTSRIARSC